MPTKGGTPTMLATCGHCPWQYREKSTGIGSHWPTTALSVAGAWTEFCRQAQTHEETNEGHRVTVWDSPTSQYPRNIWTDKE